MENNHAILIVDPDSRTRALLKDGFEQENYTVFTRDNCEDGFFAFQKNNIHLVICEGEMTGSPNFCLLENIRSISNIPVMIVSQLVNERYRIQAFEKYTDDYVTKPFSVKEVVLRGKRLISYFFVENTHFQVGNQHIYPFMKVDLFDKKVEINHKIVRLAPKEFELLRYFIEHPDEVISRETLLQDVWKYTYFGEERNVDTHVKKLRKKLRTYSELAANSIQTEWGRGYRFNTNPKNKK